MSNLGLHKFCEAQHLKLLCAAVGDRNVLELMQKEHMVLGGEQSGHIIFLEHMTTGDGQLAALQFLSILGRSGKKASELAASDHALSAGAEKCQSRLETKRKQPF